MAQPCAGLLPFRLGLSRRGLKAVGPLDAWRQPHTAIASGAKDLASAWLGAAKWWTDALADGASLVPGPDAGLLVQLAASLARAYRGRRFSLDAGGRPLRATLESVAV